MADQKSRGGQKEGTHGEGKAEDRHVHPGEGEGRDMKEDAARGKQGQDGGYSDKPRHQEQRQDD